MGKRVLFPSVLLLLLAANVQGAAIKHSSSSFLDGSTVPCTLCAAAMPKFLDFCKFNNGYSVPHLSDWVNECSQIGEKEEMEMDIAGGCNKESALLRSRARSLNRKGYCLRIYEGLAAVYKPFDPCTQIRKLVDNALLSVCQGPTILCIPPQTKGDVHVIPPSLKNVSLPVESPPLRCPQYVGRLNQECQQVKQDFYARSNLDHTCEEMFSGEKHQISGCESVRMKMVDQDYTMDLCSSLSVKPITITFAEYCTNSLGFSAEEAVPDVGYAAYLERVRLLKLMYSSPTLSTGNAIVNMYNGTDNIIAPNPGSLAPEIPVDISK